jgi:hypothetical protein
MVGTNGRVDGLKNVPERDHQVRANLGSTRSRRLSLTNSGSDLAAEFARRC